MQLFLMLICCANRNNKISLSQDNLAKYLKVSRQTIGKHLHTFAACEMLKYKFSGVGIINPEFYYVGDSLGLEEAKKDYAAFKSDF